MEQWYVDVQSCDTTSEIWKEAIGMLPSNEQHEITRFYFEKDKKLALASRILQRHLIHTTFAVPWETIVIARTPEGKPYWLRPPQETRLPFWNFNVSHHGTIVAIAAHATSLIGVDVVNISEQPRSTSPSEFFKAFERYFTVNEWQHIRPSPSQDSSTLFHAFYEYWSLKEAYIKAIGIGLGFNLLQAEFVPASIVSTDTGRKRWKLRLHGYEAPQWDCQRDLVYAENHIPYFVSTAIGPVAEIWQPSSSSSLFPHMPTPLSEFPNTYIRSTREWQRQTLEQLIKTV